MAPETTTLFPRRVFELGLRPQWIQREPVSVGRDKGRTAAQKNGASLVVGKFYSDCSLGVDAGHRHQYSNQQLITIHVKISTAMSECLRGSNSFRCVKHEGQAGRCTLYAR